MIAGKIKEMKLRSGMTNQQVADLSGVPIGTVNRVMSDQVQNPNFETISAIVMALGGSIDEIVGHTPTSATTEGAVESEKPNPSKQIIPQKQLQQKESTSDCFIRFDSGLRNASRRAAKGYRCKEPAH